jgi:hypothetical protein
MATLSSTQSREPKAICGNCRYFQDDPKGIEEAYPGLASMSSGFASVRDQDGLCNLHDRYLSSRDSCPCFALLETATGR